MFILSVLYTIVRTYVYSKLCEQNARTCIQLQLHFKWLIALQEETVASSQVSPHSEHRNSPQSAANAAGSYAIGE
jgi:hypothetical protein